MPPKQDYDTGWGNRPDWPEWQEGRATGTSSKEDIFGASEAGYNSDRPERQAYEQGNSYNRDPEDAK
jgi:hypothetical protein